MQDAISDLVDTLRDVARAGARAPVRRPAEDDAKVVPFPSNAPATVSGQTVTELRTDPREPGLTVVTIYAPTEFEAQQAIDRCFRMVDISGGNANFKGPKRCLGGWGAIGEIRSE